MASALYTNAVVYLDGAILAEAQSIKVDRETGSQETNTIVKGWAGVTPGASKTKVSVENAVPSADFEVDPGRFMKTNKEVELTIFCAGRTLTSKGVILSDSFNYSVGQDAKLSFEFVGPYAEWT